MKKILFSILFAVVALLFFSQDNVVHAVSFGCGDVNNNGGCIWAYGGPCSNDSNGTIYMNAYCTSHAGSNCASTTGNCDTCATAGKTCLTGGCGTDYSSTPGICTDPNAACCIANNATPTPTPLFGVKNCYEPQIHIDGFCVCDVYNGTIFTHQPCPSGTYEQQPDCQDYCNTVNNAPITPAPSPNPKSVTCGSGDKIGIETAIGCIHVLSSPEIFLGDILRWAVGIGGGIAFLLILYAGFMVMTSAGNPERLKAGQELLTSAISGLILLIFSVFILKFIGVDILGLCKFGFGICPP